MNHITPTSTPLSTYEGLPAAVRARIMAQAPTWADITRSDIDHGSRDVRWTRRLMNEKFFTADLIADSSYDPNGNPISTEVTIDVWAAASNRITFISSDHIDELVDQLNQLRDIVTIRGNHIVEMQGLDGNGGER